MLGSEDHRQQSYNSVKCNLQKCIMYTMFYFNHLTGTHAEIEMKSTVLGCLLLLLLDGSCWMAVGGQTCELTCKIGYHWYYSTMNHDNLTWVYYISLMMWVMNITHDYKSNSFSKIFVSTFQLQCSACSLLPGTSTMNYRNTRIPENKVGCSS